ncbi:MAG: hypothetical protein N0E44_22885 [Candidatus Thiodiazotropha lotti]|nr:hypothetical protein [Candidatus Thiodiazotropha lotti]MCW4222716.1 hypothetical protein [Candidatus Thiodiazotropha lotti]
MSEKRKETPLPEADQTPEDNDNPLLIVLFVVIIVIAAWGLLMLGLAEIFVVGDA